MRERVEIKTILAVRNDRFGEFLLNIPAFRALKETFPESRIVAVVHPSVRELAGCVPYIDDSIEWDNKGHRFLEKVKLVQELKKRKPDMAVMLNPSGEFNMITFLAGIPRRIGYARKMPFLLTGKIADEKHLAKKHEVEYNLDLVSAAGAKTADKTLCLSIDESIIKALLKRSEIRDEDRIVAVHPFTSDPVKQWPPERFVELSRRIAGEPGCKVAIIGGKEEIEKSKELYGGIADKNMLNLTGVTTLKELAGFLKRCALLISGDSGPVHLACCVRTPVIALFRNDLPGKTPRRWGPWGSGNIVIEENGLDRITVDAVFRRFKEKICLQKNS